jgi:hypothetical protein
MKMRQVSSIRHDFSIRLTFWMCQVFSISLLFWMRQVFSIRLIFWMRQVSSIQQVFSIRQVFSRRLFGADPDRIGLLGKPPAAEHSFPSKSQ